MFQQTSEIVNWMLLAGVVGGALWRIYDCIFYVYIVAVWLRFCLGCDFFWCGFYMSLEIYWHLCCATKWKWIIDCVIVLPFVVCIDAIVPYVLLSVVTLLLTLLSRLPSIATIKIQYTCLVFELKIKHSRNGKQIIVHIDFNVMCPHIMMVCDMVFPKILF